MRCCPAHPPCPPAVLSTRCATACSAAASDSGRCWCFAAAEAVSSRPDGPRPRDAGGVRHRVDPHLLADPRRPAGDGQRHAAPRAGRPRTSCSARGWPSWPATACSPRRSRLLARLPASGDDDDRQAQARHAGADRRGRRRGGHGRRPGPGSRRRRPGRARGPPGRAQPDGRRGADGHARAQDRRADSRVGAWLAPSWRGADAARRDAVDRYGAELGLAFQIVDDILDVEGASAELGKTAGKDAGGDKPTYPALYGLDRIEPAGRAAHRARRGRARRRRPVRLASPDIARLGRPAHALTHGAPRCVSTRCSSTRGLVAVARTRPRADPRRPGQGRRARSHRRPATRSLRTPPSTLVTPDHPYVSRGGLKLAHALDTFAHRRAPAAGARHRRLDRRLHRRAAPARRRAASSPSTSATTSWTGRSAAIRASPSSSTSTRAT